MKKVIFFVLIISCLPGCTTTIHPSGDITGVTDAANIRAEIFRTDGVAILDAGTFYIGSLVMNCRHAKHVRIPNHHKRETGEVGNLFIIGDCTPMDGNNKSNRRDST